ESAARAARPCERWELPEVMRAALALAVAACSASSMPVAQKAPVVAAKLTVAIVEMAPPNDPSGHPIGKARLAATLTLHNTGNVPLWVNRRMADGESGPANEEHEVWLEVRGPDGQPPPYLCAPFKGSKPSTSDYVVLQPGDTVSERKQNDDFGTC